MKKIILCFILGVCVTTTFARNTGINSQIIGVNKAAAGSSKCSQCGAKIKEGVVHAHFDKDPKDSIDAKRSIKN